MVERWGEMTNDEFRMTNEVPMPNDKPKGTRIYTGKWGRCAKINTDDEEIRRTVK